MPRGQFYLDKSNAKVSGVCAGIARYTGVDALWVRVAAVALTCFGFYLTIPIYIAVALLATPRPLSLYDDAEEERMLRREAKRRGRTERYPGTMRTTRSSRIGSELTDFDRRVRDLEAHYSTSSSSRLSAEIDSLR